MKHFVAALALVFAGLIGMSGVAGAQTDADEPQAEDFIDPETGEVDLDAYLAAVQAANASNDGATADAAASASGTLPATGSSLPEMTIAGVGLIVVGGAAIAAQRRRSVTGGAHLR